MYEITAPAGAPGLERASKRAAQVAVSTARAAIDNASEDDAMVDISARRSAELPDWVIR